MASPPAPPWVMVTGFEVFADSVHETGVGLVTHSVLAARGGRLRARCAGRLGDGAGGGDLVRSAGRPVRHPDQDDRGAAGVLRGDQRDLLAARAEVSGGAGRAHLPVV